MRAWRGAQGNAWLRETTKYSAARLSTQARHAAIGRLLNPDASGSTQSPRPNDGDTVEVNGFVRSVRKQKRIAFAALGDGSSLEPLQAVLKPEQAEGLSTGAAVKLRGEWQRCPPGKQQTHELHVTEAQVLGENDATSYPLQKKYHSPEFLRTLPHLRARSPFNSLLLRLRSQTIATVTTFFANSDFIQTHTPIITSSDCEGAGEVFTISSNASKASDQPPPKDGKPAQVEHFFRTPKYLTVSSQLHLEALAQSVGKVWTLSPTFRAEKSDTPRHLSEFYMLEAEVCFTDNMNEVMDVVEGMLRAVGTNLKDSRIGAELLQARRTADHVAEGEEGGATVTDVMLAERWEGIAKANWPRVQYKDAVAALQEAVASGKAQFQFPPTYEDGFQAEHERYLATHFGQGSPVFITHYPRQQKPFYMSPSLGAENETVACFDLLVPDLCELVGGSMREYRSKELLESMRQHGLLKEGEETSGLDWYVDLRRYGSVPHGGFGLGFDRLLSYLSGVSNIRDVVAFPRWYGRCDC